MLPAGSSFPERPVLPARKGNQRLLLVTEWLLLEKMITFGLRNGQLISAKNVYLLDVMDGLAACFLLVVLVRRWGQTFISFWRLSVHVKSTTATITPTIAGAHCRILNAWNAMCRQMRLRGTMTFGNSRRRYHHEQRRCCIPKLSIYANNQPQEQDGQSATFSDLEMPRAVQKSSMDRGDPRLSLSASDESSTLPLVSLELSEIDKDS